MRVVKDLILAPALLSPGGFWWARSINGWRSIGLCRSVPGLLPKRARDCKAVGRFPI